MFLNEFLKSRFIVLPSLLLFLLVSVHSSVYAKGKKAKKAKPSAQKSIGVLKKDAVIRLLRTTMIAIDHANKVGNYSVLRGLGNSAFQKRFKDADLAISFHDIRQRKIDFSPLVYLNPVTYKQPAVSGKGIVRLNGFFPTKPLRVIFDISYQTVDGKWYISDLAVGVQDAKKGKKTASKSSKKKKVSKTKSKKSAKK